jgi:hypothetical protein
MAGGIARKRPSLTKGTVAQCDFCADRLEEGQDNQADPDQSVDRLEPCRLGQERQLE